MFPSLLPTFNRADIAFVRGEGPYIFAEDGTRYLDFGAGIAVNALGHAHPELVETLREQAGKIWHTSNLYRVPGQESLSKKLVDARRDELGAGEGGNGIGCQDVGKRREGNRRWRINAMTLTRAGVTAIVGAHRSMFRGPVG